MSVLQKSEKFLNSSWFWALYDSQSLCNLKSPLVFHRLVSTIKVSDKSSHCITSLDPAKDGALRDWFPKEKVYSGLMNWPVSVSLIKTMDLTFMLSWKVSGCQTQGQKWALQSRSSVIFSPVIAYKITINQELWFNI